MVTADGCEVITRFPAEDLVIAGKPYYTVGGTLPLERDHQSNRNTRWTPTRARRCPATAACRPATRCASEVVRAAVVEAMGRPPAAAEVPEPAAGRARRSCGSRRRAEPGRAPHLERPLLRRPPRPPYVIGLEGVGVVEEGERLAPGTRVRVEFVHPGYGRDGAVAEYAVAPEEPDASDRASQASVAPIGRRARRRDRRRARRAGVHRAHVPRARAAGRRVAGGRARARDGATGAVGLVAVQLAKLMGAARVVAAGPRPRTARARRALGADAASSSRRPGARSCGSASPTPRRAPRRRARPALGRARPARPSRRSPRDGVYVSFGQAASPRRRAVGHPAAQPAHHRRRALGRLGDAAGAPGGARAGPRLAGARAGGSTLDAEELALDEIGDGWERSPRSAGRRLVVRP